MEKLRNAYKILVGKSEWKRPFGRPRRRREVILEWILGKYCRKISLDATDPG
jgi:hypothetical protein